LADANNHAVLTDGVTGFGVSLDQIYDFVDCISGARKWTSQKTTRFLLL
jgi:hypothetical protein